MTPKIITDRVTYCGVNDREKHKFDNLYPLPDGVSYNSYIVTGDDKTAIVDGSDAMHAPQFIKTVREMLDGGAPDYIVVNHAEPDHTGALPMLRMAFPDMKIVGNRKTFEMLDGFYGLNKGLVEVSDGDTLGLGGATLRFITAPMVHWPETMFTYLVEQGVLFSGDAFGCFGALNGAVVDDEIGHVERYFDEAIRYYGCIVAKYGTFVTKAIAKVADLEIRYICTTHGPVWHSQLQHIVELYASMARWEADRGVVIVYGSMYGATTALAENLADEMAALGVKDIRLHDISSSDISRILADIMRYKGLVLVSPTYNTYVYPPMQYVADALTERGVANRVIAVMGTCSWSGQAYKRLTEQMSTLSRSTLITPGVEGRQNRLSETAQQIKILAQEIVKGIDA